MLLYYNYFPLTINYMTPNISLPNNTIINIYGTNFSFSNELKCYFGYIQIYANIINDSLLNCIQPPQQSNTFSINLFKISYYTTNLTHGKQPSISFIEQISGSIYGKTLINITGLYFYESYEIYCMFHNNIKIKSIWISNTMIQCLSPSATKSMIIQLFLTNINGDFYSYQSVPFRYTRITFLK